MHWWGDDPQSLAPEVESLLDAEPHFKRTVGMAVVEARTGVHLDASWVDRPQLSFVIPDPSAVDPPEPATGDGDLDLMAWWTFADRVQQRKVRDLLIDLLADRFDVERGRLLPDSYDDHGYLISSLEASGEPQQVAAARTIATLDNEPGNVDLAIVHARSAFDEVWLDVRAAVMAVIRGNS